MRYLWFIPIALFVVMFLGCSWKTTVHEEMINTSPSDENKDNTGQQLSDEIQKAADDEKAKQEGFMGTDDASLVERLGEVVKIIPGSRSNIKITNPEDLNLARAIISSQPIADSA